MQPFKSLRETSDKVHFNSKVSLWDRGFLKGSAQLVVNDLQGNEVFSCWLPVPLSPLSASASHCCVCQHSPCPSPSPGAGPCWAPPSPSPRQPPPRPAERKKKKKKSNKKRACNIFTRQADFPGCKSTVGRGLREQRQGG